MDPKNIWITFPELLTWFPLIAGLVAFMIRKEKTIKTWAIGASLVTLIISVVSILYADNTKYFYLNNVSYFWLRSLIIPIYTKKTIAFAIGMVPSNPDIHRERWHHKNN